jgi:hypothetical protein
VESEWCTEETTWLEAKLDSIGFTLDIYKIKNNNK